MILPKQLQAQVTPSVGGVGIENYDEDRFQRELDQIQQDTTFRANPQIPLTRRLLIDYGGYTTGGITPANTIDFDTNRPDYDSNTHRGFYGAMLSMKLAEQRPFVYGLWQLDFNHDYVFDTPVEGMRVPTHFRYNSYYLGTGISGPLSDHVLYGLEGVYEGGRDLSNSYETENSSNGATLIPVTQTDDTIQACAVDGHVDYVFNDTRRTRLSGELTFATGDHDRLLTNSSLGGNRTGTRDHAFNGFSPINTGLAFSPVVSNIYVLTL